MMWEALREAIDEEMEQDPTVLVMGAPPAAAAPKARDRGSPCCADVGCPWTLCLAATFRARRDMRPSGRPSELVRVQGRTWGTTAARTR